MKKVIFILAFLMLASISFVSALSANVTVIDEIGSFSGAFLRIKSPVTEEVGDKIYASEYHTNVGIIKFEIETSLPEVLLNVVITKDGMIVANEDMGPYAVNGSKILIDRREKLVVEVVDVVEEIAEVNESAEEVEEINESAEEVVEAEVVEIDSGDDLLVNKLSGLFLTGKAIFVEDDGSINLGFSAGGFFLVLMFGVFVFMMVKSGRKENERKGKEDILSEDDKELAYMDKKVKDTENRIMKIKSDREKKAKVSVAKLKLAKDEKELLELEKKEMEDSETIEDTKGN